MIILSAFIVLYAIYILVVIFGRIINKKYLNPDENVHLSIDTIDSISPNDDLLSRDLSDENEEINLFGKDLINYHRFC